MSSGSKTQTTTQQTTSQAPAWANPYYEGVVQAAQNYANQPFQPYPYQLTAPQTQMQQQAAQLAQQQAFGGNNVAQTGSAYANQLLGGAGQYQGSVNPYLGATTSVGTNPYAGSNSYLQNMIDTSNQDVMRNYNQSVVPSTLSQFAQGGAFGGTAMQQAIDSGQYNLGKQLSQNENQYRFQDYGQQQQLAENALNRQVGAQQTDLARNSQLAQNALNQDYQAWNDYSGRQMQALGYAPQLDQAGYQGANFLNTLGGQQQVTNQNMLTNNYNEWLRQNTDRQQKIQTLIQALGSISGQNSSSTSTTGANPNYRSAGQNAATAASILAALYGSGS